MGRVLQVERPETTDVTPVREPLSLYPTSVSLILPNAQGNLILEVFAATACRELP